MKPWEREWQGDAPESKGGAPWERDWQQSSGPTDRQKTLSNAGSRFLRGMTDPIDAGAQLLTHALPEGLVNAVNSGAQFVNDLPGIGPLTKALGMTPATSGGLDKRIREGEQEYQAARQATAPATLSSLVSGQRDPGFDLARAFGNVATGFAVPGGNAAGMGARILQGAGAGAASGALQPVVEDQDNFWSEKGKQTLVGGATGAAVAPIVGALARVIRPNTSKAARTLLDEGVTPTPGQILGGAYRTTEDKMTSLPLIGDAITSARKKSLDELNRAVYQRALTPIGQKADDLPVGREGVARVQQQLADAYDALLPKLSFKADKPFTQGVNTVRGMVRTLPRQIQSEFDDIYRTEVVGRMTPQGLMNGQSFKDAETALGQRIRRLSIDPNRHAQQLKDAVQELRDQMRQGLTRANPAHAAELKAINQGWSNYARIRDAGSRLGDKSDGFTPADLLGAVRKNDRSVGKGQFATGRAQMQDLADAAVSTLPNKYPDSGTTGRAMISALSAGALGGSGFYLNPLIPITAAAGALPYMPGGRQLAAALLARRGAMADPMAQSLRNATPKIAAGVAPLVYQPSE